MIFQAIGSFTIFPERVKRKFIDYAPSKWQSEFPIQYSFDGTHSRKQKQMIRLALTYWRNTTCLEFEEREDQPQTDRIVRLDRDDYIKIHTENTHTNLGGSQSSFEKESIINSHQIPYDYGSLMHYKTLLPRDNLSEPALKAMSTRISLYQKTIGQRDQLSFYDVKLMNKVYCSDPIIKVDTASGRKLNLLIELKAVTPGTKDNGLFDTYNE
uniref:Peptidase M12A domain-containing protein n=1 Tax=Romanomermis culicivorax TaxID=13658 RepID=A0A915HTU4_ROMCU